MQQSRQRLRRRRPNGADPRLDANEVVSIYLTDPNVYLGTGRSRICTHPDYQRGDPLPVACSPCTLAVAAEQPSCVDTAWDDSCVALARELCPRDPQLAPRPVTAGGDFRLARGTADVVSEVCAAEPSCCDEQWTSACGARAKDILDPPPPPPPHPPHWPTWPRWPVDPPIFTPDSPVADPATRAPLPTLPTVPARGSRG